ncbi:hypothetical protein KUW14_11590 [Pseudooceanicola nitratireducens]|uniref:hypothetical protein n=1 Tax=Pseudooceanicola nitratireducens TaxID=517719 RepID=UPI001C9430D7|nr:hypothetical protein [Pseudooceanicola nitratireducens]MBY6166488.1 hypothetical protein [Pseudooceanicola nitratireducens]
MTRLLNPVIGLALILPLALSACANLREVGSPVPVADAAPYDGPRPPGRPGDMPATEATGPLKTGDLGVTIASLGNAAEPGVWLKTPLVQQPGEGQVSYQGRGVTAQLIPIAGPATAGSRASLQLMQQLGAPLTGLPELRVSR